MPPKPRLLRRLRRLVVQPLLALLLPTPCRACGTPLGAWQRHGVCCRCWADLPLLALNSAPGFPAETPGLDAVVGVAAYEGIARTLVLAAKLEGRKEIFGDMAIQLAAAVRARGLDQGRPAVVPVPSHPWQQMRRGFAPGGEIARPLASALDLPLLPRLLRRRWGSARALKALGRRSRRVAVRGAFRARSDRVQGPILLVDDVLTTGASATACAAALRAVGATDVRLAVWARTPGRLPPL